MLRFSIISEDQSNSASDHASRREIEIGLYKVWKELLQEEDILLQHPLYQNAKKDKGPWNTWSQRLGFWYEDYVVHLLSLGGNFKQKVAIGSAFFSIPL